MSLESILTSDDVVKSIRDNLDYLLYLIPELRLLINFDQENVNHDKDAFEHTLFALDLSDNIFVVRLVLLLHDIAKPRCWVINKYGGKSFPGHPEMGAQITHDILTRLGYEENFIEYICYFIKHHDYPMSNTYIENNYEDACILYQIQECDGLAHDYDHLDRKINYLDKMYAKLKKDI